MQPKRSWKDRLGVAAGVAAGVTLLVGGVLVGFAHQAAASSHREAPLISKDPYADSTDTYAFLSPADQNRLVLLASWIPFEGPEGGPNYYEWDDSALYDIYVDNNGDATADYTYTLSSQVQVGNPDTFLYNTGPIGSVSDADLEPQAVLHRDRDRSRRHRNGPGRQPAHRPCQHRRKVDQRLCGAGS